MNLRYWLLCSWRDHRTEFTYKWIEGRRYAAIRCVRCGTVWMR